jgi:hypothetical protein
LELQDKNVLIAPAKYTEAQALAWYRTQTKNLITQYAPQRAAVRASEANARGISVKRMRIEGVVMECACSEGIEVLAGALPTLSARLGINRKDAKQCLKEGSFRGLSWPKAMSYREAILAAAAAIEP